MLFRSATGDFTQSNNCPASLAVNATCTVNVVFAPTAVGSRSGSLSVTDNAASSPQAVSLSGTGAAATLQASASSLSFGGITAGTTSTQTVVISNTGSASATISAISTGNSAFTVSGAALPATVAAGSSLTLTVTFAPTSAASYSGTLAITSNATDSTLSVALSGTGNAVAAHSVTLSWSDSASGLSGYNVYRSTTSGTGYAKINSSLDTAPSYVDTAVVAGGTYYYVVTAVNSSGNESAYSAQVSATIPGGTAAPAVSFSPTSLTFAGQTVGTTSSTQAITLTNSGTASLAISGIAASGNFSESNNCPSSLAAAATCTISVAFSPTATGSLTGTITVTDNASGGSQTVALSGTGNAAPTATLQASASSLSFGGITAGTTSTQTVVISNTGNASATISAISTGNSAFTVSGATLPATVAAGSSLTLTITFAPTSAASYSGTLTITSNATDSTLSVALSGTGNAVAHSVTLNWSDSASGLSGYNVYRSTTSGTGYTKINSSLDGTTSYVDTAVVASATYYYVVTAVDGSGNESAYSAQVSATIP